MQAYASKHASLHATRITQHPAKRRHRRTAASAAQTEHTTSHHLTYGGLCTRCGVSHCLVATPESLEAARALSNSLDQHRRFDYESPIADPAFSTDFVWTRGPGRMMGVLVCVVPGAEQAQQQIVLKAFSGQMTRRWDCPGWVGPVAGITHESPLYAQYRQQIEALTEALSQLHPNSQSSHDANQASSTPHKPPNAQSSQENNTLHPPSSQHSASFTAQQRQLLSGRRKALSRELLQQIQDSYVTQDLQGRPVHLREVCNAWSGMQQQQGQQLQLAVEDNDNQQENFPAGTGDCAAIKLLHAAAVSGLSPRGLVEFWYGSPVRKSTSKQLLQGRSEVVRSKRQAREAARAAGRRSRLQQADRQHGQVYGACDKCQRVLGTLLCQAPLIAL